MRLLWFCSRSSLLLVTVLHSCPTRTHGFTPLTSLRESNKSKSHGRSDAVRPAHGFSASFSSALPSVSLHRKVEAPTAAAADSLGDSERLRDGADEWTRDAEIGFNEYLTVDDGEEVVIPALPSSPASANQGTIVSICIPSTKAEITPRSIIRSTWMQHPFVRDGLVKVFFLLVEASSETSQRKMDAELLEHQDMVYVESSPRLLDSKPATLDIVRWAALYLSSTFIMKLDINSFPNLDKLVPILKADSARLSILGHIRQCSAEVLGDSDATTEQSTVFRQFAQGGGFILSRDMAVEIGVSHFREHQSLGSVREGESIGMMIALDTTMNRSLRDARFKHFASSVGRCSPGDILTLNVDMQQIRCMWEKSKLDAEDHCCTTVKGASAVLLQGGNSSGVFREVMSASNAHAHDEDLKAMSVYIVGDIQSPAQAHEVLFQCGSF